ncbi:hypothetical protein IMG5_050950 [Ichthyophthirius multifiliis]|uniref:Uncharacterized protein n=1 Tax=Ichthyophthirius multifiliis TaxID=5932 RepID=G0QMP4_ICHMU|nr:hypothetical protein IMG5_050950 [Ichthyophthirius multifiliis]EGR33500.1 hypothetical protein IMG5_050950 [Ichthyophthirius multifiliis]|eukprot:XP_004037486.1 hypothetical protein IMG5_050950 [Ichthyophthirius multifiliis]
MRQLNVQNQLILYLYFINRKKQYLLVILNNYQQQLLIQIIILINTVEVYLKEQQIMEFSHIFQILNIECIL